MLFRHETYFSENINFKSFLKYTISKNFHVPLNKSKGVNGQDMVATYLNHQNTIADYKLRILVS